MKNLLKAAALPALMALAACTSSSVTEPQPIGPIPTAYQVEWHKLETYAFIHFGLNTYADREWGYGDTETSVFNPTLCDPEQWVRTFKEAGMTGVVLTAKHHDGFCLWPTELTEYCIRNTPYKDGKGDIVGELCEACRKYGLKLGLYLSPWDRNQAAYGTPEYVEYYNKQLEELTTKYGTLFEFWLDGANGGDGYYGGARETRKIDRRNYYNFPNIFAHILNNQPQAIIFTDGGPGCRWVGNERGIASATNWAFIRSQEVYPGYSDFQTLQYGHADGDKWVGAECDVSIRPGWFYHDSENDRVKSPEQLVELYYQSVGHNANFILNVPVNKDGLICKTDSINLVTYHEMIQRQLATDILSSMRPAVSEERGGAYVATALTDDDYDSFWSTRDSTLTATIEFNFPVQKVNRMMLQEYIPLGQRVKKFSVEYKSGEEWLPVQLNEETTTIGYKRLLRFPTVETDGLRVNILDARACPCLNHIGAYYGGEGSDIVFVDKGDEFDSVEFTLTEGQDRLVMDLGPTHAVNVLHYLPPKDGKGIITHYELYAGDTPEAATKLITKGEFSNIQNNPILQTLRFAPTPARVLVLKATSMVNAGEAPKAERMGVEVFY